MLLFIMTICMWTKVLIYFRMGLSIALVVIPCGIVFYWLWKKISTYFRQKAQLIKENKELKHIKTELQEQKEEFITNSEYGPFVASQETENKILDPQSASDEETSSWSQDTNELAPELLKQSEEHQNIAEKEKKRLDTLLHFQQSWTIEKWRKSRTIWKKTDWSNYDWWYGAESFKTPCRSLFYAWKLQKITSITQENFWTRSYWSQSNLADCRDLFCYGRYSDCRTVGRKSHQPQKWQSKILSYHGGNLL